MRSLNLVISVLRNPANIESLGKADWNRLLIQAYHTNLLARLYVLIRNAGLQACIPAAMLWHFSSALKLANAHARDVRIEITKINQALKMGGLVPVYLKGAAYELADSHVAEGRLYSDVDIYIIKSELKAAEHVLKLHGWRQGKMDQYDQQYYRRWMHEIPPLVHNSRGTTLDVHHNLLPPTCRIKLDTDKLDQQIDRYGQVLSPIDRILHSIVHLLMESEFDKGLRDISDIDLLINKHAAEGPVFWEKLLTRADDLGVGRLLFYAARYARKVLGTQIPERFRLSCASRFSPGKLLLPIMDKLFLSVLCEPLGLNKTVPNKLAHFVMYLRGHWLRMPLHLLLPHLLRKAIISPFERRKLSTQPP